MGLQWPGHTLREKYPNTEFFWSVVSHSRTEYGEIPYLSVFSPNVGKYGPGKTLYLDTFHAVVWNKYFI